MFHCATCGFSPQLPLHHSACHCQDQADAATSVLEKRHSRWTLRDVVHFMSLTAVGFSGMYVLVARWA